MRRPANIRMVLIGVALVGAGVLASCDGVETRTVSEVKSDYAQRFAQGLDFGLAGRIKAESYDPETFILANVQIDDSPDRIYHADYAEMHVSAQDDTIVLEFIAIVGADAAEGGITMTSVATTPAVRLGFDVVE